MKRLIVIPLLLLIGTVVLVKTIFSPRQDLSPAPAGNMVTLDSGSFLMGSHDGFFDEKSVHEVSLRSFRIDRYEVTCREYRKFLQENPAWRKGRVDFELADIDYLKDWDGLSYPQGKDDYPVAYVSWHAARAYARWAGKALPSEAQWEYASRGGFKNRPYPWGNAFKSYLTRWKDSKVKGTARVGQYTINGFGLNDVIGNVAEWTADGYELYQPKKEVDPLPSINRHRKVIRGGSWKSGQDALRVSARRTARLNACLSDVGIRCVSIITQ